MRFFVLGPVGVLSAGRRTSLARGQQRTILAVLLAAGGEDVSTDRLVDSLWGPTPPATARKSLQSHLSRLRHHQEVLHALPRVISNEPYDERAHGQLMRALVAADRRGDALAHFHGLEERLRDELGVDPSPVLRGLHEQILRQDSSAPATPHSLTATAPPVGPAHRTDPLLGRERDLDELGTALPHASLVTLTGPGGVGKTSIAERLVTRTREQWRDGVVCCALAHVRDADRVEGGRNHPRWGQRGPRARPAR